MLNTLCSRADLSDAAAPFPPLTQRSFTDALNSVESFCEFQGPGQGLDHGSCASLCFRQCHSHQHPMGCSVEVTSWDFDFFLPSLPLESPATPAPASTTCVRAGEPHTDYSYSTNPASLLDLV